jgi:glycosyltransferase involved in cell wall biosynthesis
VRVLYVNPFSQEVSGPDESLRTLIRELTPRGVEPHLVLPHPGPQVARYQALGVTVHFAPLSILRRRLGPADVALMGPRLLRGAGAVAQLAQRIGADLIHTNMEVVLDGGVAARLLGLPHVLHYRGNTLDEPRVVFDLLTLAWVALADRLFCISRSTADIFVRRGRAAKVQALYNPVDVAAFGDEPRSPEVRAALGVPDDGSGVGPDAPLVGTVGRIHPRKDMATFVRAAALVAASHPRVRFAVVGAADGAEEEAHLASLRALAADVGVADRLVFTGARRDMPATFRAFDVFVLASRHEGFGRVAAEAMAAGIPAVVSREGALPELVEDGVQGFHAEPAQPQAFAAKIGRLLDDPDLRARFGQAARLRARAFDAREVAAQVMATYQALCGQPPG